MVALSWLAFFVPPEVISGRMVLLVILLLMLTNVGKYVNRKTITFTAQYTFSCSCVCGGKYSLEFKLHGGPHLATGLSDSDHRQYRPVCLRPLHYGQGGEGEGERGPGAASVSPVSCSDAAVSLIPSVPASVVPFSCLDAAVSLSNPPPSTGTILTQRRSVGLVFFLQRFRR